MTDEFARKIREEIKKQVKTPSRGSSSEAVDPVLSSAAAVSGYNELQNLIGSLNVDFKTPRAKKSPKNSPDRSEAASRRKERAAPGIDAHLEVDGSSDTLNKARDLLRAVDYASANDDAAKDAARNKQRVYDINRSNSNSKSDYDQVTKIKFGTSISIRHGQGRYMSVISSSSESKPNISTTSALSSATLQSNTKKNDSSNLTYNLGVDGQGIGEEVDCLCFVNSDNREDTSTVRYGSTVSLKATYAKDRYLSVRDGKIGFFRSLIGKAEKWTVIKCISSKGVEDAGSVGIPLCTGDVIMLADPSSGQLLSVYDGVSGREPRLVTSSILGLGEEVWHLELFGNPPLPAFMNRPYLSGRFMTVPANVRNGSAEAEGRTFPGRKQSGNSDTVPKLTSYSPATQQAILTREVLCTLSGVEGQYIRVAAADSSSLGKNEENYPTTRDLSLVLDIDDVDRSVASQINLLLPICECGIRVRDFIKVYSRYEYGKVSQSLAAGIRGILREFDLLVAQLEMLELKQKLTMQKLMFHVQPAKITLKTLDRLCARLRDTSGGRMLDVLYGKYFFFIRFLFISLTLLSIFFKVVCLNREMIRLVSFTRFYSRLLPSHSSRRRQGIQIHLLLSIQQIRCLK